LLVLLFGSGAVLTGLGIAAAIAAAIAAIFVIFIIIAVLSLLLESGGSSESEHRDEVWPPAKQPAADKQAAALMTGREWRHIAFLLSGILALIFGDGVIIYYTFR
jgi:hypothetical protein